MKPKTTILLVLALGCGLAAAFMTNKLIAERNKGGEEAEKVNVVVAKAGKKIPAMTYIKRAEEFFEVQERSKSDVPKNALNSLDEREIKDGFRVARAFSEGTYLTRDDLISADQEGLSAKLPPGMRALAVRVTAETLAGGFVLPGSKVDVLWTFRSNNEVGSLTILQDMLVLAVDTTATRNPENPATILGATVTLAVKPEEAEKVALATNNGEIRLVLRNVKDDKKLQLKGAKPGDLAKSAHEQASEDKNDSAGGDTTASAPPPVPPIPALAPSMTDPATNDEPAPVRVSKIHKLTIEDGPNIFVHKYVYDDESKSWDAGGVTRSDVVSKPPPKPDPKPDPKTDPKPGEPEKKGSSDKKN
jgi:pilus assembly protein CpaB